ncbi:MAG: hypothetical protein JW915_24180 [Chitinispirillaceae bacterium]|nr:hypothetical protein [Chitinispirillaceae bacterium]
MYTTIQIVKEDNIRIKTYIKKLNKEKGGRHAAHEVITNLLDFVEKNNKKNGISTVSAEEIPQI